MKSSIDIIRSNNEEARGALRQVNELTEENNDRVVNVEEHLAHFTLREKKEGEENKTV